MKKTDFFFLLPLLLCSLLLSACSGDAKETSSGWTITQHGIANGVQGLFYTIEDPEGNLAIIDGGYTADTAKVMEVIASHGGHVSDWILTHPHPDHIGAFNQIAGDPTSGVTIDRIYAATVHTKRYQKTARSYDDYGQYETFLEIAGSLSNITYLKEGDRADILGLHLEVLSSWCKKVSQMSADLLNNASLVFTLRGDEDCMLFLADLMSPMEKRLIRRHLEAITDADYVQLAHHGNWGLSTDFYDLLSPRAVYFDAPKSLIDRRGDVYDACLLWDYFAERKIPAFCFESAPNVLHLS